MTDTPDDDEQANIIRLEKLRADNFLGERQQKPNTSTEPDLSKMTSIKVIIDWVDKYYAGIVDDGDYKILNLRLPGKIQLMTRTKFIESLEHLEITITGESGNPKRVPFSQIWLKYAYKRYYDQFVFDPSYEFDPVKTRSGNFNLWPGFATKPKKGDCRRFLRYMKYVVCAGSKKHFRWLCAWIAQMVQHPEKKPGTAVVLIGQKGAGKSFFGKKLNALLGDELCFTTARREDLFGDWNDHIEHTIFLQLEEAIWAGNRKEMSELNEFLTGMKLPTRTRFKSTKRSNSFTRALLTANDGWVIPATFDERRYVALYISVAHQKDKTGYFDPFDEELDNGGLGALMYFFKNFNISKYDLSVGLETQALLDQKVKTAMADKSPKGWWISVLHENELPFIDVVDANDQSVAPTYKKDENGDHVFSASKVIVVDNEAELVGDYYYVSKVKMRQMYAKFIGKKVDEIEPRAFGLAFNSLFPELDENGYTIKINNERRVASVLREGKSKGSVKDRVKVYKIPKLSVCRNLMNAVVGYAIDWDNIDANWESKEFS